MPYESVSRTLYERAIRGTSGAANQGTATPDGFTGANTEDLAFEIAARIAAAEADIAVAGNAVSIKQFESEVTSKPDPDDPNTWDWTPAITAGLQYMRDNASIKVLLSGTTYRYEDMPTLHFPKGVYRNTATHTLQFMRGWAITADEGVLLQHEAASYMFVVNRCQKWSMSGFTAKNHDPGAAGTVKGLMQNSGFMRLYEYGSDPNPTGGNTLEYSFHRVKIREFHRAFRFEGNQMLDNATWFACKFHDNFIDFDYHNGQAVNHHVYGGEAYGFVSFPLADYQARLDLWTGTSWTGGAWHPYDGAEYWLKAGGQVSTFGGSRILNKARYHVDQILSTDDVGTTQNTLGYYEYNVRYEMRTKDPAPVTMNGRAQDRITMIRHTNISPPDSGGTYRSLIGFSFDMCSWNMQDGENNPIRLFQLANGIEVKVRSAGQRSILNPQRASVAGFINDQTRDVPANFRSDGMPILLYERLTLDTFTLGASALFADHRVRMDRGGGSQPSPSPTAATDFRTAVPGPAGDTKHYQLMTSTGVLWGTGGASAGPHVAYLGKNARLKVIRISRGTADASAPAYSFTYTDIYGNARTRTATLPANGLITVINVEEMLQSGEVTVNCTATTATTVFGYIEYDYA